MANVAQPQMCLFVGKRWIGNWGKRGLAGAGRDDDDEDEDDEEEEDKLEDDVEDGEDDARYL